MSLATARQLWRLNKEGRLILTAGHKGPVAAITPEDADAAIREGIEAGLTYNRREPVMVSDEALAPGVFSDVAPVLEPRSQG